MIAIIRAIWRLTFIVVFTAICIPIQYVISYIPSRELFYFLPRIWARSIISAMGIRIVVTGETCKDRPVFYIANHSSYLDILMLTAVTDARFISKASVADWPLFGLLAKIQGTIFINRSRGETKKQTNELVDRLQSGDNLILFAEGTTSDGNRILPLKSSLLDVARHAKAVQPVTIAFTSLDKNPIGRTFRYFYAWIGDESLVPHLMRIVMQGEMEIMISFYEPVYTGLDNRKALAQTVEITMREGLNRALNYQAA